MARLGIRITLKVFFFLAHWTRVLFVVFLTRPESVHAIITKCGKHTSSTATWDSAGLEIEYAVVSFACDTFQKKKGRKYSLSLSPYIFFRLMLLHPMYTTYRGLAAQFVDYVKFHLVPPLSLCVCV